MRHLPAVLFGAVLAFAGPVAAQEAEDAAAVHAYVEEYQAAWAAADADRMFAATTDDVEWINIVGMHWRGRADVTAAHEAYLTTIFRGVPMTLEEIESIRPVGDDVLVAVVRWAVGAYTTPGGHEVPATRDRMTLVLLRTPEGLRLAHAANIEIDERAAPHNPIQPEDGQR